MSSTRSASAWVARLSAAAPKSVTVLICPVRPNGRFSIMGCPFPYMLVLHMRMQPDYPRHEGRVKSGLLPGECVRLSIGVLGLPSGNHHRTRAPHLDEFCQDADANLLRRPGMNVEANRSMHPI